MNKIVICGRLTKDPELRTTNNGTEVCGFTVAVDRRIKKNHIETFFRTFLYVSAPFWKKPEYSLIHIFIKATGSPLKEEWNRENGWITTERTGWPGA